MVLQSNSSDPEAFRSGADTHQLGDTGCENIDDFSPEKIAKIVRNSYFKANLEMIMHLNGAAQALADLAESCTCHEWMLKGLTHFQKRAVMRVQLGREGSCPLSSFLQWKWRQAACSNFLKKSWTATWRR